MSLSSLIAPQLPYLRRYARALTGSQRSGDDYVATVLEALIADQSSFDTSLPPRVALYRTFSRLWNSLEINHETDSGGTIDQNPADRRIEALTPLPRQAFLLVAVEGFGLEEAGKVLDVAPETLSELLSKAGEEIAEQLQAEVLIIEDEPLIAMDIEALVTDLGHTVQSIARTHQEAVAAVAGKRPSLVLADIQLADGSSGLDAVHDILGTVEVPVIFITAYPERLLTGERPEPVFLISKPFQPDTVKALISQALFFENRAHRRRAA